MASSGVITLSKSGIKKFILALFILTLAGAAGFATWKYNQARAETKRAQENIKRLSDPNVSTKATEDELIEKVRKIALVPADERPTIANISDAEKLKDQPLFALIQNGDKVLLYTKARREVVYRPSTNQIITVVTLPEDSKPSTPEDSGSPQSTSPTQ